MRSAILMGSVAMVALATPAFALPDRYEQGYSCTGQGAMCTQQQLRLDDGNRAEEKARAAAVDTDGSIDQSGTERSQAAARTDNDDNFGDEAGDEIENTADEAGDEISDTADEAGDEIENAADEAGDEISDAADEVGDAFE
jgi:gas vesicle protein